jgi:hypothetical protein
LKYSHDERERLLSQESEFFALSRYIKSAENYQATATILSPIKRPNIDNATIIVEYL